MAKRAESSVLLLDTHVWVWMMGGERILKAPVRELIDEAVVSSRLRLSAISLWEIALLTARGRLDLGKPTDTWMAESLADPGPIVEPLSPTIAVESCYLPGRFHSDPADRIIVATARVVGATLLTRDRDILDYAAAGYVTGRRA
ncbi:MAG: type II toxin-antitoxin system VapC family toxin [Alphaproteobacteria bacterium]|nr:type II toxin-antitoxin system VapC family toxin [Alphaproteobacteria bacterium]